MAFTQEASESTSNRSRRKEKSDGGTPPQQVEGKQRDKGGVPCHHYKKKVHYYYECSHPTLIPHSDSVVHLNVTLESTKYPPTEDTTDSVPDFHFLNLDTNQRTTGAHGVCPPDEDIAELLAAGYTTGAHGD